MHRDALAAADTGGAESVAPASPAEGMQQVQGDAGAARAQRVAQGHGPAVEVGALAVETELTLDGEVLRGEGLVDLDQVHVAQGQACPVERLPRRRRRADAHPCGSTPATPHATSRPSGGRPCSRA